jgi:hypothetical protein
LQQQKLLRAKAGGGGGIGVHFLVCAASFRQSVSHEVAQPPRSGQPHAQAVYLDVLVTCRFKITVKIFLGAEGK